MTLSNIPYNIPTGKYRLRILYLIDNKTRVDYHVFSVLERLEPDMQDYNDKVIFCRATGSGNNPYKLYFTSCDINVTTDFIENPIANFVFNAGKDDVKPLFFNKEFAKEPEGVAYYTLTKEHNKGVGRLMPERKGAFYVKTYIDKERVVDNILHADYLQKQLKELSEKYYGVDLSEFKEHIGNCYLVWHDAVFKSFDFKANNNPNGIIVDIGYRTANFAPFKIRISDIRKPDCIIADYMWEVPAGTRAIFIPLECYPSSCSFSVYAEDGSLIYATNANHFLTQIVSSIGVSEKAIAVTIKDDNGNEKTLDPIVKFRYVDDMIGSRRDDLSRYFADNERFHNIKELEDIRDFIFFNGSKDDEEKKQNKEKGRKVLRDIINRAKNMCYICDPYFKVDDLVDFVIPAQSLNVKIRIINSKAELSKDKLKELNRSIGKYNKALGITDHIECRVLRGDESRLHDRFIIADEKVWYLGSSFSEFGTRACSLAKLSQSAALAVKTYVEEWWQTPEDTIDINSI